MIKDGVEAHMAIVDTTMVPRDQVLWPAVNMLAGRRCCEHLSETPRVLLPPAECETSDGRTIPHRRM